MSRKIFGILIAIGLFLSPVCVKANTIYATNEDGTKSYTSIDSAWNAAQSGVSIVMQCDWNISSRLILGENKKATIEMNGHKISRNLTDAETNGEVIMMEGKSTLTLNGKKAYDTKFTFNGFDASSSRSQLEITTGGLITGGSSTNGGGGIHMKAGSTLNLNYVAVAGNYAERSWGSDGNGGGICMDGDGDTLNMVESDIKYNRSEYKGGGVYIDDEHSTITMKNSIISWNYSENGGGICTDSRYTKITMDNGSIRSNVAEKLGGGVFVNGTNFEISSDKGNSEISFNEFDAADIGSSRDNGIGSAIYVRASAFTDNEGLIKGIRFAYNETGDDGTTVTNDQENVTISNCTFTGNIAGKGAILISNDGNVLENITVEDNTVTNSNYGAVYIDSMDDITLKGKVIIRNNHNTATGIDSDLYLQKGSVTESYIISVPDSSSSIGLVQTGYRVIAKNQTQDAIDIYKINGYSIGKQSLVYDDSTKTISLKEVSSPLIFGESSSISEESSVDDSETVENTHTVTLNKVNESGSWSETETITVHDGEFLDVIAPSVEDRTFVEYRDVPESITVEEGVLKADSLNEDVTVTVVYTDTESEGSPVEQIHTVTLNIALEDGTILNTEQMEFSSLDAFKLLAPIAEGKTFVEWKDVPEDITVEGEALKADILTSDIEVTAVYSEPQGESSETGSIFGNGSGAVALVVVVALLGLAGYNYYKKKN